MENFENKVKEKDFIKWLEDNEIVYFDADIDLMLALYAEYEIEKQTKIKK